MAEEISHYAPTQISARSGISCSPMLIRLSTETCGRARLCGMGRARPSRVNHSRPWGVQGGGYVGFSPPFLRPAQRSFAVFVALCCDQPPGIRIDLRQRLGIKAGVEGFRPLHREDDQLQGDRHFRQRTVAATAEHSIGADFQPLGFLVAASAAICFRYREHPAPTSGDARLANSGKYYFLSCVFFPPVFMANASSASRMIRSEPWSAWPETREALFARNLGPFETRSERGERGFVFACCHNCRMIVANLIENNIDIENCYLNHRA